MKELTGSSRRSIRVLGRKGEEKGCKGTNAGDKLRQKFGGSVVIDKDDMLNNSIEEMKKVESLKRKAREESF